MGFGVLLHGVFIGGSCSTAFGVHWGVVLHRMGCTLGVGWCIVGWVHTGWVGAHLGGCILGVVYIGLDGYTHLRWLGCSGLNHVECCIS